MEKKTEWRNGFLWNVRDILGINVQDCRALKTVYFTASTHITKMLKMFEKEIVEQGPKKAVTPIIEFEGELGPPDDDFKMKAAVGILLFISQIARPDICH